MKSEKQILSSSIRHILFTACALALVACSSGMKLADIPSTANPQEEIARLDADIAAAAEKNIDVLAAKEFGESRSWLNEARSQSGANGESQEDILKSLRKGRGYLQRAYQVSENRAEKAPGLFEARRYAILAGASKNPELESDFRSLDKDVSSKADSLDKLNTEKISELQERYVVFERRATIQSQLGTNQAMLNGWKKEKAMKLAPATFKKAETSLKNAESAISTNVRSPEAFGSAVNVAVADTALLNEVMTTIQKSGNEMSEPAALKIVAQNSQIKSLRSDLVTSNAEGAANQTRMTNENQKLSEALNETNSDLRSANSRNNVQKAMESARTQFTKAEAEAYQQGGNLLIRLKQMNFAVGKSDLPGASLALLAKVSQVAKSMNASEMKVEGHADSTGSASLNNEISEQRAAAVASYFKTNGFNEVTSKGYGFQKPIATNKSKEGRAQNRRVDIIITPDKSSSIE